MKFNVTVSGNVTVEAENEVEAIKKVKNALHGPSINILSVSILESIEVESKSVYPI